MIDYKDVETIKRFISAQAKIIDPKWTGTCAKHQRMVRIAVKRARFMGLAPFTGK